jgi:hypothetical protein
MPPSLMTPSSVPSNDTPSFFSFAQRDLLDQSHASLLNPGKSMHDTAAILELTACPNIENHIDAKCFEMLAAYKRLQADSCRMAFSLPTSLQQR